MQRKYYYVYIATNQRNTVLYTGITNNLVRRIYEHQNKIGSVFTSCYNVNKLVYFESYEDVRDALNREKQIKGGSRQDKINLIQKMNPAFDDLYPEIV